MVWIAVVLGVFLFYKFVERKHKILLLKIASVLCLVGLVVFLSFLAYEKYEETQKKNWFSIEFYSHNADFGGWDEQVSAKKKFWKKFTKDNYTFNNISKKDLELAEAIFVRDESEFVKNFGSKKEVIGSFKDDCFKVHNFKKDNLEDFWEIFCHIKSKKPDNAEYDLWVKIEKELIKVFEQRLKKIDRNSVSYSWLYLYLKDSLYTSEGLAALEELFGTEAVRQSDNLELEMLKSRFTVEFNKSAPGNKSTISVKTCNNRKVKLLKNVFYISGFEYGRSTQHPLFEKDYLETKFESDKIINPGDCSIVSWTLTNGQYFDSYKIRDGYSTWASE